MTTSVSLVTEPAGAVAPQDDRPEGLPENFQDTAALAASYKELQAELTRLKQGKGLPSGEAAPDAPANSNDTSIPDPAAAKAAADAAAAQKAAEDDAAKKAAAKAGVDLDPYQAEFNSTGEVSEESRAAIAKALEGLLGATSRTVVDQYIDGRKTTMSNDAALIKDAAGGADAYTNMVNWAAKSLQPDEIAAYNAQVNSGNKAAAVFAVEALRARFEKANGAAPKLYKGTFTPPGGDAAQPFKSSAEVTAAMRDPQYKKDPAYRERVKQRLAASNM